MDLAMVYLTKANQLLTLKSLTCLDLNNWKYLLMNWAMPITCVKKGPIVSGMNKGVEIQTTFALILGVPPTMSITVPFTITHA